MTPQSDLRQELVDAMDVVDARLIRTKLGADGRKFKSDFEAEGRGTKLIAKIDFAAMISAAQR